MPRGRGRWHVLDGTCWSSSSTPCTYSNAVLLLDPLPLKRAAFDSGWASALEHERSYVVIEEELVRRRPHTNRIQLFVALELEPLVDGVLREDVAAEQKLVIALERCERLVEASRHLRHVLQLLWAEGVDVLVHRVA